MSIDLGSACAIAPIVLGLLTACPASIPTVDSGSDDGGMPREDLEPDGQVVGSSVPDIGADAGVATQPPLYLLLFCHTEDPFNHERSEERYERIVPMLERLNREYPESNLVWTIEFQGSDALTVAERNAETGVADLLRASASEGLVAFGYHGQHDATYLSKPMTRLTESDSFSDMTLAVDDWITCRRSLSTGECLEPGAGGILAIEEHFGPVEVVSGLSLGRDGSPMEMGPGRHAVRRHRPQHLVGFGFPDHGSMATPEFVANVDALMSRLTPSTETASSAFWADDSIKINDGAPLEDTNTLNTHEGPEELARQIAAIDRSRPHVMNAGLGSKYLYTASGYSPTIYGYSHPASPALPPAGLQSDAEIEGNYLRTEASLEYLASEVLGDEQAVYIVRAEDIVDHVAPSEFWEITPDELLAATRDLVASWGEVPPDYATDGNYYYSLRDLMGLLARALTEGHTENLHLSLWYGPWESVPSSPAVEVERADIYDLAATIFSEVTATDAEWNATPPNFMSSSYRLGGQTLNAAQALQALAREYVAMREADSSSSIAITESGPMPVTFERLQALNCLACEGTAWSLKPAVVR